MSAPPCQGHGERERELGVLPLLIKTGCRHHTRAEGTVVLGAFCHPFYHSLRAWLGRDKLRKAMCHYRSENFKKVGKKNNIISALGHYHSVPFFFLRTLEVPTAGVHTSSSELRNALLWFGRSGVTTCRGHVRGLSQPCHAASECWGFTRTPFCFSRLSNKHWDQTPWISPLQKRAWLLRVVLKKTFHLFLLNENASLRMTCSESSDSLQFLR